ncbi:MAG: TatD family hydrolase [Candidatus Omnitrophica bacterium]|nr:TatD family hydrolase [Candidatus Omnitrophota bacterium]
MTLIDTHAHLDHLENLDQALNNAVESGVEAIVAVSMDLNSCRKNLEIKRKTRQPKIALGMGMHPSEANRQDVAACLDLIRASAGELSAVGEIGLDFGYKWVRKDQAKREEQREVFRAFLEAAKELNLPAIIHARGIWRECLETAQSVGVRKAVFHWYSGPVDVLSDIIKAGYFVSTAPSVAYSPQSREAMAAAPVERTLIETDCPVRFRDPETQEEYLAGPRDVARTLKAYCALKQMDEDKALVILNKNAREFFRMENAS